ncbi:lipopolysaccharide biosynthesis protein [Thiorhodococcus minor]|uniref:Oligosaccharide flippase family protein n=1 Tax=Thiorhodococcus minor TaxID=57489 RepID=A0A6M0K2N0_9GAMM|nr:oligosaccharide flippase family protein [Thiorhodococcus minor]NEV62837.1 oligosaccharide flippase family protein [Thiorhodococcus minor]
MQAAYRKHYGLDAVRKSLAHFLVGKTFRMLASVTVLLLLARVLPVEQYAVYIAFQALIALLDVLTSIGVQKVLFRYLPELRATGNNRAAYRLLFYGMLFRLLVVSLLFLAALPLLPWVARVFNVEEWIWLLPWYLLVGYLRLGAFWLSQCLESLLWQKESQYSMAVGGAVAALVMVYLAVVGELTLERVVLAEGLGESVALSLLVLSWVRRWRQDQQRAVGDSGWWRENRQRAVRYGLWSYLLSQSSLLYGSAPNRLLAAHALPVSELAILGVADSFMNLARKWVPTRMLMSMVRPLAMARFAATGDFQDVTRLSDFVFRINLILLGLPVAILTVAGPELLAWITAGHYPEAGYLLMGFLLVLATQGMRDLLELMVQALEKNPILLWTNLLQSASLLIAVVLLPVVGLWGLVISNLAGTLAANAIVIARLRGLGYRLGWRLDLTAWIGLHCALSIAVGLAVEKGMGSPSMAVVCVVLTYAALLLLKPPLSRDETQVVTSLMRRRLVARPAEPKSTPSLGAVQD